VGGRFVKQPAAGLVPGYLEDYPLPIAPLGLGLSSYPLLKWDQLKEQRGNRILKREG